MVFAVAVIKLVGGLIVIQYEPKCSWERRGDVRTCFGGRIAGPFVDVDTRRGV